MTFLYHMAWGNVVWLALSFIHSPMSNSEGLYLQDSNSEVCLSM